MDRRQLITSAGAPFLASLFAFSDAAEAAETRSGAAPLNRLGAAAARSVAASAHTFIDQGYGPGLSVAAMRSGNLIYAEGFGCANLETSDPVTPATVFRAGSITKQFVAAAIMRLVEAGKLDLDALASRYLPEFNAAGPITIRKLLNQTSGLHDYANRDFVRGMHVHYTSQQMLDYILSQPKISDFPPGDRFEYSNSNYFVLGVIVERAGGRPLGDALGDLFQAAGLRQTAVDRDSDVVPHRASGYSLVDNRPGDYERAAFLPMSAAGGAGSVRSTPRDLAQWHQALFAGRIVSRNSLAQMVAPGRLNNGQPVIRDDAPISLGPPAYGFGLEIGTFEGLQAIGHGGAVNGFTAYVVTFPKLDLSMSIMINTDPNKHEPFHQIERAVMATANTTNRPA